MHEHASSQIASGFEVASGHVAAEGGRDKGALLELSQRALGGDASVQRNPAINTAVVLVAVPYPGAKPTEVEEQITRKIEDALQRLDKVDFIASTSMRNSSVTQVLFLDGVDPKRAPETVRCLLEEMERLWAEPFPEEELQKAKEMRKGRMLLRMEDTRGVAGWMGTQELLRGEIQTVEETMSNLESVTSSDVQRVAKDLLSREHLRLAVVGPYRSDKRFQNILDS